MEKNAFDIIEKEIKTHDKVFVIGHIQPDGDCIGSSLGMKYLLEDNYGIKVTAVNQPIKKFEFLGDWILPGEADFEGSFVIQVDNSVSKRSADTAFMNADRILKIDHHIVVESYGHENVEETLSSCCEIIVEHALDRGLRISQDAARALYCGMVTDTGRFLYSSVNSDTLRRAAALLDTGFDMEELLTTINRRNMNSVEYIAWCYGNLKVSDKGVVWLYVRQDVIDRFGLTPYMVSEALTTMRDIDGHPLVVLFADLDDKIRVEFRSQGIPVNFVANQFGGGGHACAAGARLDDEKQIPDVIKALEDLL